MTTVTLIDDHKVVCDGTAKLLEEKGYRVLFTANNGQDFIRQLKVNEVPDVVVLDINMRPMDGYETALWLKQNHPEVKVLALSMYDEETAIIRMLKHGARGYCLKGDGFSELIRAISEIISKGFYYSALVTGSVIHKALHSNEFDSLAGLTDRELQFLKLACTEDTYKEIAEKMHLSPRTVEGYREELFKKLGVKSRVGLVMFAIKNGIVKV